MMELVEAGMHAGMDKPKQIESDSIFVWWESLHYRSRLRQYAKNNFSR